MSFLVHVFIINLLVISPCPYLPVFIYNIIGETSTSNTHRAIISEYWASLPRLRNITNKSESSNYTANGDLAIKSGFVNVVSSAILNSQAALYTRSQTPVPRSPFPVPRSPFPVPRSPFPVPSFSNIQSFPQPRKFVGFLLPAKRLLFKKTDTFFYRSTLYLLDA